MRDSRRNSSGFTLIELMIVIAIIGILAAVAIPQYGAYVKRAKFTEVVTATTAYKSAVQLCVQDLNRLTGCSSASNGVPADITVARGHVDSLTTLNGVITAEGTAEVGNAVYRMTPSYVPTTTTLTWVIDGSCFAAGLCND